MQQRIKIYNGKVILPGKIIPRGTVLVTDGVITAIEDGDIDLADAIAIDAKGQYISPGFIDIHIHGGGGYDFMDGNIEAFLGIAELHAKHGTTAMLPTPSPAKKKTCS